MQKPFNRLVVYSIVGLMLSGLAYYWIPNALSNVYVRGNKEALNAMTHKTVLSDRDLTDVAPHTENLDAMVPPVSKVLDEPIAISHIATPSQVKALYMTSWVAGMSSMRDTVLKVARDTEINSIVFDIKDYSGKIAYPVEDPNLAQYKASERRIPNLREYTNLLHKDGLYIIGRIAAFQDAYLVKLHPEYAVKTLSDKNKVWADRKGISWLDAGEKAVWDYLANIARDAYAQGVDEIQFDYIRFPSDGNMKDIYFPASNGKDKVEVITSFFEYVHQNFQTQTPVVSADLFGMTATNTDDLGIGQKLEPALLNFDYVCPMVYPSHFPPTWNGIADPQSKPYEVIFASMGKAVSRATALGVPATKLRPWLQEFGLFGQHYGAKEIRDQIQATYDVGLTSWMMWDPSNKYYAGGLLPN